MKINQSGLVIGLYIVPKFLSPAEHRNLFSAAVACSNECSRLARNADTPPRISLAHNSNVRSEYHSVTFRNHTSERGCGCETFLNYGGSVGHTLSYFRNKLPSQLLPDESLNHLELFPPISKELVRSRNARGRNQTFGARMDGNIEEDQPTNIKWKLTLNHYEQTKDTAQRPGFAWHRDLESNGACSLILTLGTAATIDFAREDYSVPVGSTRNSDTFIADRLKSNLETETNGSARREERNIVSSMELHPGSLAILTGPARWDFLHRVRPDPRKDAKERVSIVYGCW